MSKKAAPETTLPPEPRPVKLDGTYLEGGGQLLRLAMGLSALTHTPLQITSIRGKRRGKGGLKLQHLRAIEWLNAAVVGQILGAEVGSSEIKFLPPCRTSPFTITAPAMRSKIDIGSPGSVCLVAQAILPYMIFAGGLHRWSHGGIRSVTIHGGTNVSLSPSVDYLQHVLLPILAKIGLPPVQILVNQRGWIGKKTQMGSITLKVQPLSVGTKLPAWSLTDRGRIDKIEVHALLPKEWEAKVVDELVRQFQKTTAFKDLDVEFIITNADRMGSFYVLLVAISENGHRLGRDILQEVGSKTKLDKVPAALAQNVVAQLEKEVSHNGVVDEYMRDQLVVFQALADGQCKIDVGQDANGPIQPSLHAQTVQWVTEEILGVQWKKNVDCHGVGFIVRGLKSYPEGIEDDRNHDDNKLPSRNDTLID